MRRLFILAWMMAGCALPSVAAAQSPKTEVQGFGGLTFGSSSFGSTSASTFGGRIAVDLMPNMQVIGEGGRMSDIKSPLFDVLEYTPVGLQLSAWYGEAGVRLMTSHSTVRPYVETTAGIARLTPSIEGVSGRADAIIDAGLAFLHRTEPMLGVGGGMLVQSGSLTLDLGYRYNKIFAGGTVASVLNAGDAYHVNQVRLGVGVRF